MQNQNTDRIIEVVKKEIHREIFYYLSWVIFLAGWSSLTLGVYAIIIANGGLASLFFIGTILLLFGFMGILQNSK
jgi:hypothetical protein